MKLTHIDLFSGVGGFSLAAQWAGFETIVFCENDEYCQEVIKKHWPEVPIIPDIREITEGAAWEEFVLNVRSQRLQGGAPIANHAIRSESGNGDQGIKNTTERYKGSGIENKKRKLSCTMEENAPVVASRKLNSSASTINTTTVMKRGNYINRKHGKSSASEDSQVTTKFCATTAITQRNITEPVHINGEMRVDLLTAGVPCQPASIAGKRGGEEDARWLWPETLEAIRIIKPTWCILENVSGFLSLGEGVVFEQVCLELEGQGYEVQPFIIPAAGVNAPHRRDRVWIIANGRQQRKGSTKSRLSDREQPGQKKRKRSIKRNGLTDQDSDDSNSGDKGLEGSEWPESFHGRGLVAHGATPECRRNTAWEKNWIEIAARFCRMDDGLPPWVYRHRTRRLKALGNAIVPQVAFQIIKGIAEIEKGERK